MNNGQVFLLAKERGNMDFYSKEGLIRLIDKMTPIEIRKLSARAHEIIYHEREEKAAPKDNHKKGQPKLNTSPL